MPIYEYACKNCGHTLDELQKMSDDPLVDCPKCGEPQLKRLISAPRFRLKGKGWYETDFKTDNQRNLSSGDTETAKKDKSSSKPEKQPEASKTKKDSTTKPAPTKTKPASKASD
jgi:putative FmdB family regulatory protein